MRAWLQHNGKEPFLQRLSRTQVPEKRQCGDGQHREGIQAARAREQQHKAVNRPRRENARPAPGVVQTENSRHPEKQHQPAVASRGSGHFARQDRRLRVAPGKRPQAQRPAVSDCKRTQHAASLLPPCHHIMLRVANTLRLPAVLFHKVRC